VFAQFYAFAGGVSGYFNPSDIAQGVWEWNGRLLTASGYQKVVAYLVDQQRWALAKAIAAKNGQDVRTVYDQLKYVKTVGGNSDFLPGAKIDLSFLNPDQDNRGGDVHLHYKDGLIHIDTFNPYSSFPFGAIGHFLVDIVLGNINSSLPMTH